MSDNMNETIRSAMTGAMTDALAWALASYVQFSKEKPGEVESKEFAAQHTAAKVALAHIELIVKLADKVGLPDHKAENHNQQIVLAAMLQEAHEEVQVHSNKVER